MKLNQTLLESNSCALEPVCVSSCQLNAHHAGTNGRSERDSSFNKCIEGGEWFPPTYWEEGFALAVPSVREGGRQPSSCAISNDNHASPC